MKNRRMPHLRPAAITVDLQKLAAAQIGCPIFDAEGG
jgi:hypothetical protein